MMTTFINISHGFHNEGLSQSIIRIVDAKGSTVRTLQLKAGTAATSVNTKNLEAGVYFIMLESGTLTETTHFIKE